MTTLSNRTLVVYAQVGNKRSKLVCQALAEGARRMGAQVRVEASHAYTTPDADIAAFYGLAGNLRDARAAYSVDGHHAVFADLGYWGRSKNAAVSYHRIAVDAAHPRSFRRDRPPDRLARLSLTVRSAKPAGGHILLCGQSSKAAWAAGMAGIEFESWERQAVAELRQSTSRPILYRPKPSAIAPYPRAIDGTVLVDAAKPIDYHLDDAWCVVSHHSNAGLDALAYGIPIFAADGPALALGSSDLSQIEHPRRYSADERDQLFADLAYCQGTLPEMAFGEMWAQLVDDGALQ